MAKLLLFESGSTKTTLLVQECLGEKNNDVGNEVQEFNLSGYNPNRESKAFLQELKTITIHKEDKVFFYGSGLGTEIKKTELINTFQEYFEVEVTVFDDILGSARALYNKESGVFAILGTGGVAGYYNGESVTDRNGGYGYLIDDLGGGYELGKRVVSAWLNGELPEALQTEIAALFQSNRENFTSTYYSDPKLGYSSAGLQKIANTVQLAAAYRNHETVQMLISNYFTEFFKRHLMPLYKEGTKRELKLSGTLAQVYLEPIQKVATQFGLLVKDILRYPAIKLLEYHQSDICVNK